MSLLLDCRKYCLDFGLLSCQAVIAGVSGGADSMCLLDILFSLSEESKKEGSADFFPKLAAVHINHGLRGEAADCDENLVRRYCQEREIPFFAKRIDINSIAREDKISLEQAGRDARYAFFDETAQKFRSEAGPVFIATAHHREDQAETILMNLFRGTGPDGMCGMQPIAGNIIRPLLFASKEDILNYMVTGKIPFLDDLSNFDNVYTRNRWRNQILPLIADVCHKDPVRPLIAFSELAGTDKDFFDKAVAGIFEKNACRGGSGTYGLPLEVIRSEHRAIASRLIRFLYSKRFANATDLTAAHVSSILSLITEDSNGRRVSLAHGKVAYLAEGMIFVDELSDLSDAKTHVWDVKGGQILLCSETDPPGPLAVFSDIAPKRVVAISKTSFEVDVILVENPEQVVYNGRTWYCPVKDLRGAVIRTRKQGDWFSRAGCAFGKPLRRFLTDRKIPAFIRGRMILVACESQVLWIPGVSCAAGFADEVSGSKYFESLGTEKNKLPVQDTELYRITIRDRN